MNRHHQCSSGTGPLVVIPAGTTSWSRVWMRRRVLLGIILLCSLPNGAGRRPLLSPAVKVGHCKVTFPVVKEGGGLIALRGGEHGNSDGEDEENKELPPINETEWQRFVQAPSKSLRPGPMQMTWALGSNEEVGAKKALKDEMQEVVDLSDTEEEDAPKADGAGAKPPNKEVATDDDIFYDFLYDRHRDNDGNDGKNKNKGAKKESGGDYAVAKGMAKEMKRERARQAHLRMLEEEDQASGIKVPEGPKRAAVTEQELHRAWLGPCVDENATSTVLPVAHTPAEEEDARNRAEEILRTAIELEPTDVGAHYAMGHFMLNERSNIAAAEEAYKEALRRDPVHPLAACGMGFIEYSGKGDAVAAERFFQIALQGDSSCVTALCSYAALLLDTRGDAEGAVEMLDRATALEPTHAQSLRNLAAARARTGAPPSEIDLLHQRAIAADPTSASTRCGRAAHLGRARAWEAAGGEFRAALAIEPNNVDALKGYANLIRASAGRGGRNAGSEEAHEEALEVYRKALEVVPDDASLMFGLASVHVEAYEGALGGVHHSEEKHEEGLRLMQDVLRRHPTHVGAMAGVLTLIAGRDPPKAQEISKNLRASLLTECGKGSPGMGASAYSDAWCRLARYLEGDCGSEKQLEGAARAYVEALRLFPGHTASLAGYGKLALHQLQDGRTAECLFSELVASQPSYPGALHCLGLSLQVQNLHKDAEKVFKRAVQSNPEDAAALTSYASLLQAQRSDLGGAELLYKAALRVDPGNQAACSNYGMLAEELRGDYKLAESLYRRALATVPDDPVPLCHLAMLLQDAKQDFDGADELFTRAIKAAPNNAAALSNMATFQYSARGDIDYAEKLFKKAIAIDPTDVGALINFGSLLEEARKDKWSAQRLFDLALSLDPVTAKRFMEQQAGDQYREPRVEELSD